MYREITVNRLSAGTVFKLVATGLACTIIPFSVLMGFLSLFGASTVTWNQQTVTGVYGLIASPFIGLVVVLFLTMFLGSCTAFGLWLFSKVRPMTLLVKDADPSGQPFQEAEKP
jgi:hypothetical protein